MTPPFVMEQIARTAASDQWSHPFISQEWARAFGEKCASIAIQSRWQPIETAPRDGSRVWAWHEEGWDVCWYEAPEDDGLDSMGHDGGWFGILYSMPGRSFGNPDYFRDPQGQPTDWMPIPDPPTFNTKDGTQR